MTNANKKSAKSAPSGEQQNNTETSASNHTTAHTNGEINNKNSCYMRMFDNFDRTSLVLNVEELAFHGFPLNIIKEGGDIFKTSRSCYFPLHRFSPMFAIDCEMCLTTAGKNELTMVSIVNEYCEVLYSTLVKPRNRIINYLTQYSGITKKRMENVTTTLSDVQQTLSVLLPPDAILIGHSLENDLNALKLLHPYCIDTSLIFNVSGVLPHRPSLKLLAEVFLEQKIQSAGALGHDPTEDAETAMRLVKLKLSKSPSFGSVFHGDKLTEHAERMAEIQSRLWQEKREAKRKRFKKNS